MARPRIFPSLRSGALQGTSRGRSATEQKVILSAYYQQLASAGVTLSGQDRARPWPIERAVVEGYERVVYVFKAVETIAGNQSRLPFVLKRGEDVVEDHPLYRVLNKRANPMETGREFRKRLGAQVLLSKKGAFVEVGRNNAQEIIRLDLLPPGRTTIIPSGDAEKPIKHYLLRSTSGMVEREIDPEKVIWIREPHPIDPFSGITPLEAAGLSIELDHFARLYNVSFMRNDGRPGGIIGVKGPDGNGEGTDMDPAEMDRIEARFGRGPVEAGKLSVISGDLSYVDIAARPRDMQYQATSKNAKTEMLTAFGVPESIIGNATNSTFANAEADAYAYWTGPQANHNDLLASAFDDGSEDDLVGSFDTTSVEVLQRPLIARRLEAREEVAAGLRSIRSYAVLAGLGDEIEDTPITRALYVAGGKTPIPSREADGEALGIAPPSDPAATEGGTGTSPVDAISGTDTPVGAEPVDGVSPADAINVGSAEPAPVEGKAHPAAGTPALKVLDGGLPPHRRTVLAVQRESKAAPDDSEDHSPQSVLDPILRNATEADVADALTFLASRQVERAVARLKSPTQRKGTRHWEPEFAVDTRIGIKALDASKIADEDRWASEAVAAIEGIIAPAAEKAVQALLDDLQVPEFKALPARLLRRLGKVLDGTLDLVGKSAARQAKIIADLINELDQAGRSADEIVAALRNLAGAQADWAKGLALHVVTAVLEGSRDAAMSLLVDEGRADVSREWVSRRDPLVRPTHVKADGQKQDVGVPFEVGTELLRYPGDPLASLRETANCRCRLRYRSKASGRFVANPGRRTG